MREYQTRLLSILEQQNNVLVSMEERICNLQTQLIAERRENETNTQTMRNIQPQPLPQEQNAATIAALVAGAQPQQPRRPNLMVLLAPFTIVTDYIKLRYTSVHQRLAQTKFYRIVSAARREARRQNIHANLDLGLLMKLLTMVAIFGGRDSGRQRARGGGENEYPVAAFLARHRLQILFFAAIVIYWLQTGLLAFVWKLWNDMPRLLEENDDTNAVATDAAGGVADGDNNAEGGEPNVENNANNPNDGGNGDENNNNNGHDDDNAAAGDDGRGLLRRRHQRNQRAAAAGLPEINDNNAAVVPPRRGFANGGIQRGRRNDDNQNGNENDNNQPNDADVNDLFAFLHDIKYIIGSFWLSLVPTWRPVEVDDEGNPSNGDDTNDDVAPDNRGNVNNNADDENNDGGGDAHMGHEHQD
mmetsp:Transcript_30144/g.36669  ORF Transcript_30144/g.36669 Transcript_30144/m.36669 type:complete len:415 (+) Transcript_30144:1-1245(+)